jgi:NAD(P)-dependent dehydrogenase (short-subunit alcohol dehydrogenase family)
VEDNTSGGSYGYRMSKTALNVAGKSLSLDLQPRGVSVLILHPGFVKTDMTRPYWGGGGIISPAESARGLIQRANDLTLRTTGQFQHALTGEQLPW